MYNTVPPLCPAVLEDKAGARNLSIGLHVFEKRGHLSGMAFN